MVGFFVKESHAKKLLNKRLSIHSNNNDVKKFFVPIFGFFIDIKQFLEQLLGNDNYDKIREIIEKLLLL